jgi:hypothetical protein
VARNGHHMYCSPSHERQGNAAKNAALYSTPAHKARRRRLEPAVRTGMVRCVRGASCKFAELVDGCWSAASFVGRGI